MDKLKISKEKIAQGTYITLLITVGVLVLLLGIGTIIGLVRPSNADPIITLGGPRQTGQTISLQSEDVRIYSGLGRLRIPLVNASTLLLSISFPYPADDTTFTEELATKVNEFRMIATGYFSSLPSDQIIRIDEDAAKREILNRFNSSLRLGQIEVLYFSDMMVLEGSN